jgi:hypothetical protein
MSGVRCGMQRALRTPLPMLKRGIGAGLT